MKLRLTKTVLDAVHEHGRQAYPRECCGVLVGMRDGDIWIAELAFRAANLAPEAAFDRYDMDPGDRHRAEEAAREAELDVIGFYHTHPDHDVYFSKTDLENSEEYLLGEPWLPPSYAYFVVSVRDGVPRDGGAFVVREGASEKIAVEIIDD
ncbi:M67 family metallopeptidase [bacterium]|nr:M67 family metallopeptidase [bacterium]